jgi:putative colanic acid biosynthesis glycosyltransferase
MFAGGDTILLTIVTVVRNDTEGLVRTLDSVAGQEVGPDELVILDGSDDREAVPALLAARDDLTADYSWGAPAGVYAAMNTALARVSGEYVYFLNAGDTLAGPTVLGTLHEALSTARPLWLVGRVDFIDAEGHSLPQPQWSYPEERAALFARGTFPPHQGVVASTAALRAQGGFDLTYSVTADYVSVLKLARDDDPLVLDLTLAAFPVGGLSTQRWRTGLREFHRARREVFAPRGWPAVVEGARSARTWAATTAYQSLWAPGRPLSGIARRIPRGPGR